MMFATLVGVGAFWFGLAVLAGLSWPAAVVLAAIATVGAVFTAGVVRSNRPRKRMFAAGRVRPRDHTVTIDFDSHFDYDTTLMDSGEPIYPKPKKEERHAA